MSSQWERNILRDFLKLYREHPCLWDQGSELYKDKRKKNEAWELLAQKLKELESDAVVASAKKRIEHMRTTFQRELKKVKESRRTGEDIYSPNLWYYNILSAFLDKDNECRGEVQTPASNEKQHPQAEKISETKKLRMERTLEYKKQKLVVEAQDPLDKGPRHITKPNTFAVYVGEQLDQVATFQRQVAEKLISDVLFLAKTGNLDFDTKIETPSRSRDIFSLSNTSYSQSSSPSYILAPPSIQYVKASPSPHYVTSSPPNQRLSSSPIQPSASRQNVNFKPSSSPQCDPLSPQTQLSEGSDVFVHEDVETTNAGDSPANSVLKELLISKKHK